MRAVYASNVNHDDPMSVLAVGERPEPQPREYWSTISVKSATVNHHDLWSLQGVGLSDKQTPMILGTDAAGVLDDDIPVRKGLKAGAEVVLYTFVGTDGNGVAPGERRTILSEKYAGTMAEKTSVPSANVFAKPANLTMDEAAALGTSWLTAYSLVFSAAGVKPGDTILVQGAGGGVSTAAIMLAHAAGLEVFATSRSEEKRAKALEIGADAVFGPGERLPRKVDAVIESVGAATWSHSVKSVRPGGTIAVCGATTGDQPGAELTRVFFQDIRVQGVTMGTRDDFARLLRFVEHADIHPVIDSTYALADAHVAFRKVLDGDVFGKVVLHV
ncbi:zinc-binding dehydrogenase [Bifidobacterium sp. SMB2]|uniref:Zinc-binding dehydrogenase n=1 Tax=Bifidobacterium saimiriisciurei TaxID=2661627 RepID=A0ABX0C8P9_9BIFI|nr:MULTISPECIES: zinc-binding dehydrogenase [Bifidobacterium]NEG96519.1 zinc-binding dehydrogenase [Bifidobacterium sp. SMB2]NEH10564.1 zinc-binding dehydrogenase [Bifidobacterium saimiriisciurei]NEH10653.1 zinc-binding dehydrogenase [Bifidobacterium saimiriisciurei]